MVSPSLRPRLLVEMAELISISALPLVTQGKSKWSTLRVNLLIRRLISREVFLPRSALS